MTWYLNLGHHGQPEYYGTGTRLLKLPTGMYFCCFMDTILLFYEQQEAHPRYCILKAFCPYKFLFSFKCLKQKNFKNNCTFQGILSQSLIIYYSQYQRNYLCWTLMKSQSFLDIAIYRYRINFIYQFSGNNSLIRFQIISIILIWERPKDSYKSHILWKVQRSYYIKSFLVISICHRSAATLCYFAILIAILYMKINMLLTNDSAL